MPRVLNSGMPSERVPFPPMEAQLVTKVPTGEGWQYEPKWDGFRGILENEEGELHLWSRNGRPLLRYFPELRALGDALPPHSALDGEIVIEADGRLDFDAMQMRLHPAESRIRKLSIETPARYIVFDVLLWRGEPLHERPLRERRADLVRLVEGFDISPASTDLELARTWLAGLETAGLDGIVCKRLDRAYRPGARDAVVKIKREKTADCVIVGYRGSPKHISTLLLGLYRDDGTLDFVGHTSGITATLQKQLQELLPPLEEEGHLGEGRAPGGESRWTAGRELAWTALRPEVVCEVRYDKVEGDRFRHGTRFLRFRSDKEPRSCTWDQVIPPPGPDDFTVERLLGVPESGG